MNKAENDTEFRLSDCLVPSRILIRKGKQTKKDVLLALVDVLAAEERFGTRDDLEWGIFHREGLLSTGIGNGIAIPHVLLPNLNTAGMALALCPDGISDYQTYDMIPVSLVFMLVSDSARHLTHLKMLGSIGSRFYDGRLKAAFLAAPDAESCMEILKRSE